MSDFEDFLNERMRNGKTAENLLPPERLAELRRQWEKELSGTGYMRWFIALPADEMGVVLGWEAGSTLMPGTAPTQWSVTM